MDATHYDSKKMMGIWNSNVDETIIEYRDANNNIATAYITTHVITDNNDKLCQLQACGNDSFLIYKCTICKISSLL